MAWTIAENALLGQAIADISTTKKHSLGKIIRAKDPTYGEGEFIYLGGVASCAAKDWCHYNLADGTTTRAVAGGIGPLCVAMGACTASYYGWFQIQGKALAACKTLFADNGKVWLTSTAGSVDDSSVAGDGVQLAKGASTTTAGTFYAEIGRAHV